ncbi:MAG: disulfide bond formation protein B [Rickettsiales bacterium]|nr:disulfide bond formation protein B [Rickettsiales bacterium]
MLGWITEKPKTRVPLVLLAACILALGGAYTAEYGFGLRPCILCLYQRIPYAAVGLLALITLVRHRTVRVGALLLMSVLAFSVEAGIAFYHVGVEYHWWAGTSGCTPGTDPTDSIELLRQQIAEAPLVSCDEPALVVLGLSMAGWNIVYALVLLSFCILVIRRLKGRPSRAT